MPILFPTFGDRDPLDVAADARRIADDLARFGTGRQPTSKDLAGAPIIDMWRVSTRDTVGLIGVVAGHPSKPVGARPRTMLTSELFAIDVERGWARTWSRFYLLGRPVPFAKGGAQ